MPQVFQDPSVFSRKEVPIKNTHLRQTLFFFRIAALSLALVPILTFSVSGRSLDFTGNRFPDPAQVEFGMPGYQGAGNIYYVAPNGNNANPGTITQPWKTIQKAARTLVAGDTVYIRRGTYHERVIPSNSGSPGDGYITYASYPAELVTLDGTGISVPVDEGLIHVAGRNYLRISGLRVIHSAYAGILVDSSGHVILENNDTADTASSGIGIWGSHHIILDGNQVERACSNGMQEYITMAGTDVFVIRNNRLHRGAPGFGKEGITVKQGSSNGTVYRNQIYSTLANGIYVDAFDRHTFNIDVFQNIVYDVSSNGIALASEQGGLLERVRVYNNIIYHNKFVGIWLSACCPGVPSHPLRDITIINNTLYNNGWEPWGGGIGLDVNPAIKDVTIRNNILSQNLTFQIAVDAAVPKPTLAVDNNLIHGFRGSEGEIYGATPIIGAPRFMDPFRADFHLQPSSPAIDRGSSEDAPLIDFDGNPRPLDGDRDGTAEFDVGAYELVPTSILDFRSQSAADGWLLESSETSSAGGSFNSAGITINLGDDQSNKQYRSILSFDTSGLPDDAVVVSASLRIKRQSLVGIDPFTTHQGLLVDIANPYFGTTALLVTSDFQAAAGRYAVGNFNPTPASGWYSVNLNTAAFLFINKAGTTQFRLRFKLDDDNDSIADYMKFFSGDYATASCHPVLSIKYYLP